VDSRRTALLVFCGNNRRQRQLHAWRGKPFANDHLGAFFNAAVDAGIALSAFVIAAEAAGTRLRAHQAPSAITRGGLRAAQPADHVFPVAGLASAGRRAGIT
jgi:nitroreductase/FMN reductase [NAD(P)H]